MLQQSRFSDVEEAQIFPQSTGLPVANICYDVISKVHLDLRNMLNIQEIIPYLNRHNLLSREDLAVLTDPRCSTAYKVDVLLLQLTKSDLESTLCTFIDCLRESELSAGRAHEELADILEIQKAEYGK